MGSESTQIVVFDVVLNAYHESMNLPHAIKNFVCEMEKLGAGIDYTRYMPTAQISVELHIELPGSTLLNCNHTVTFDELVNASRFPASENARVVLDLLIDKMGVYVIGGIEKALEVRQTAFLPTGMRFKGFEIILKADRSNSLHASANAAHSLKHAVRDLLNSDPWELTADLVVTGSPSTTSFLTCDVDTVADLTDSCIHYVPVGLNYRGFPVLLKFTVGSGDAQIVAEATVTLRKIVKSSKDDWSVSD